MAVGTSKPVFSLRRGELAAYFPDARSADFDWKAHPRFVCDRCSGVTVVDRDETMIAEGCLFCDAPRPGEAQWGPGLLEQMVELGSLRQRVMWLEEALRDARKYDLSVRLKRKIDEYLARVAPGSSESATTRGHGSRGVGDSTPPVGVASVPPGVETLHSEPAGGTSDQPEPSEPVSDEMRPCPRCGRPGCTCTDEELKDALRQARDDHAFVCRQLDAALVASKALRFERDAAEDGFRYEQQRADRAEAERDGFSKGVAELLRRVGRLESEVERLRGEDSE